MPYTKGPVSKTAGVLIQALDVVYQVALLCRNHGVKNIVKNPIMKTMQLKPFRRLSMCVY